MKKTKKVTLAAVATGVLLTGGLFYVGMNAPVVTQSDLKLTGTVAENGETLIDKYFEQLITFDEFNREFSVVSEKYKSVSSEELDSLMNGYMSVLRKEENKYNAILTSMNAELYKASNLEGVDLEKGEGLKKINSPLLVSLLEEVRQNDMMLHKNSDGLYSISVNYDQLKETYSEGLTPFMKEYLTYKAKTAPLMDYDATAGSVKFADVYEKLVQIEKHEGEDKSKDDYYWEFERLGAFSTFAAFGDDSVNLTATQVNENYLKGMKEFVEAQKDNSSKYVELMKKVVEQIEKDNVYGDATLKIVNDFINEDFKDYLSEIEKQEKALVEQSE